MNIIKIPAKQQIGNKATKEEVKKLRVAAYCRVSTDNEEQAGSYETQVSHYREFISANPEWILVDVYADEGISATNTKKRDDFNRMIDDCKKGIIDMIFTKSISRFARNTVDCLNYIRMLKDINIPVFFEKENINTMDAKGEVLITIMASLAQQESESISKNVKLGLQYRYQHGKVLLNSKYFLGYDKDEDGNLVVNPKEAEVVKRIFLEYLQGSSCQKIAKGLERDSILTARGNPKWHDSTIRKILENEKYMGDALLQKTYTVDFLNKKRVKNNGIVPQYYIEDHHEAIIPKELFLQVQDEIARRASERDIEGKRKGFSANHAFSQIVFCAECGGQYRRIHWNNRGKKSIVWRCLTRLKNKDKCRARTVKEEVLQEAFLDALNEMLANSNDYLNRLTANLEVAIKHNSTDEKFAEKMKVLQQELLDRTERRENYDDVATEILRIRELQEQSNMDSVTKAEHKKRIQELQRFIKSQPTAVTKFDECLAKNLLSQIIIHDDFLEFKFKSGVTVSVEK